jgi:hypothetical protein
MPYELGGFDPSSSSGEEKAGEEGRIDLECFIDWPAKFDADFIILVMESWTPNTHRFEVGKKTLA